MTDKSLSEKICEVCGIKPEIIEDYDNNQYEIYPDFENNKHNKLKLIDLLIENDHIITMNKNSYLIGNGDIDFIQDCYDEYFDVQGSNLLEALYNYLTRKINESHILQREDCYYLRGFDDYLKDIEQIKQAIREADWGV